MCRGKNKALPDAQASPLSATSLSFTAAVLGAIQPSLSSSSRSLQEPAQSAKNFKRVRTRPQEIVSLKKNKKHKRGNFHTGTFRPPIFLSLSLSAVLSPAARGPTICLSRYRRAHPSYCAQRSVTEEDRQVASSSICLQLNSHLAVVRPERRSQGNKGKALTTPPLRGAIKRQTACLCF